VVHQADALARERVEQNPIRDGGIIKSALVVCPASLVQVQLRRAHTKAMALLLTLTPAGRDRAGRTGTASLKSGSVTSGSGRMRPFRARRCTSTWPRATTPS
jgi:hypothetical protein